MQEHCSFGKRQGAPVVMAQGSHRLQPLTPIISPGSSTGSMSVRVRRLCSALAGLICALSRGSSMSYIVCMTRAWRQRSTFSFISSTVPQAGGQA